MLVDDGGSSVAPGALLSLRKVNTRPCLYPRKRRVVICVRRHPASISSNPPASSGSITPPPTFLVWAAGDGESLKAIATVCLSFPAGPTHSKLSELDAVSGPMVLLPSSACSPAQLSDAFGVVDEAVQVSASSADQVKVTESRGDTVSELVPVVDVEILATAVEFAFKVTFGRLGLATPTAACCRVVLPPGPLQKMEKIVSVFRRLVLMVPAVA